MIIWSVFFLLSFISVLFLTSDSFSNSWFRRTSCSSDCCYTTSKATLGDVKRKGTLDGFFYEQEIYQEFENCLRWPNSYYVTYDDHLWQNLFLHRIDIFSVGGEHLAHERCTNLLLFRLVHHEQNAHDPRKKHQFSEDIGSAKGELRMLPNRNLTTVHSSQTPDRSPVQRRNNQVFLVLADCLFPLFPFRSLSPQFPHFPIT